MNESEKVIVNQAKEIKGIYRKKRDAIVDRVLPVEFDNLRQIRQFVMNLSIIAGALASFTLMLLPNDIIKCKMLLILADTLLLITIGISVNYLSKILQEENNKLAALNKKYCTLSNEVIQAAEKLEEAPTAENVQYFSSICIKQNDELKDEVQPKNKKSYIIDIMVWFFSVAIILIICSIVNFESIFYNLFLYLQNNQVQ